MFDLRLHVHVLWSLICKSDALTLLLRLLLLSLLLWPAAVAVVPAAAAAVVAAVPVVAADPTCAHESPTGRPVEAGQNP